MFSATTRVIVYDSSSLQSELLATGLESLALGFEIKCANNLESLVDLLSIDPELGGSYLRYQHERQRHFPGQALARALSRITLCFPITGRPR